MLKSLAEQTLLRGLTPVSIADGIYQGIAFHVERVETGEPVSAQGPGSRGGAAGEVAGFLSRLRNCGNRRVTIAEGSELFTSLVSGPLMKVLASGGDPALCEILQRRLRSLVLEREWTVGFCHGSLSGENILCADGKIVQVVDWRYGAESSLPILDAINYAVSMERHATSDRPSAEYFLRLGRWDWPVREEMTMLRAFEDDLGIDASLHDKLCDLAWLRELSNSLDTTLRLDTEFVRRQIEPMAAALNRD